MSSTLMMSDMSTGGVTTPADGQSICLEFEYRRSCFKGRYPAWAQVEVTPLLAANGLTDEKLAHELRLIDEQVSTYYGGCMKCYVLCYLLILIIGFGAIGAQFGLSSYRQNIFDIIDEGALPPINDIVNDFVLLYVFVIGGILAIILFMILMCIHRECLSRHKYKKTMKELKDYVYGFDLQNKYALVKWQPKHIVDGVQFDIIVTPLQREAQEDEHFLNVQGRADHAMSTVSI